MFATGKRAASSRAGGAPRRGGGGRRGAAAGTHLPWPFAAPAGATLAGSTLRLKSPILVPLGAGRGSVGG